MSYPARDATGSSAPDSVPTARRSRRTTLRDPRAEATVIGGVGGLAGRLEATVLKGDSLHVQGATAYPVSAASARVRIANFRPFLAAENVMLTYRSTATPREYALLSSDAAPIRKAAALANSAIRAVRATQTRDGLLLVHRLLALAPLPGVDPPRRLDAYDLDDALFVGSAAEVNRGFQWVKQERRRAIACMRRARLVTTANSFLADRARAYAGRVEVVPSCVDAAAQPLREHQDAETLTIGWIGSHTTVGYLRPILPVLERLDASGQRLRLVVVGGDTGVRADWIEHRQWTLEREAADLAGFDIGIMPLPDTEWAQGKAGYKLLQYFSAGVPAIASPVGVNPALVAVDRGLLATTPADWEAALRELGRDAKERALRGAASRSFVEREYSYQRWAPELAELLRSLVA